MSVNQQFSQFMHERGLHDAALSFGVATSGGPDSLCLALTAHEWAKVHGATAIALTVDHGLRPESVTEAQQVHQWLTAHGMPHHTLTWSDPKPTTAIQESARNARYDLLLQACHAHSLTHLLLGHHSHDQRETFLMRLTSGSGPHGLACMAPVSERQGITLLRPFLNLNPAMLKSDLSQKEQSWIEDPSNQCHKHTRIRFRKFLEDEDFDPTPLIKQLQEDRTHFEQVVNNWCSENVESQPDGSLRLPHLHELSPALGKRILRHLIQSLTHAPYPVSPLQLDSLWQELISPTFMGRTLGHCHIRRSRKGLQIKKECDRKNKLLSSLDKAKKTV